VAGQEELPGVTEVWDPLEPSLQQVFHQIPAATGVPGVHVLWRLLAEFPRFLTGTWPALAVYLRSESLHAAAETLVQASFLVDAVGLPSHKAFRGDLARAEIDADLRVRIEHFNDLSQIGVARLLAVAAGLHEGAWGRAWAPVPPTAEAFAPGPVEGVYVPPLRPDEARGKAVDVLATIEREHRLPFLDDYYRSLARIPDYLSAAWNAIRPIVGDPVYLDLAASLGTRARVWEGSGAAAMAAQQSIQACEPATREAIRRVLDAFVDAVLPQTLIDISLIKALTSGPERATSPSASDMA
jgi:hypothetical protein